MPEPGSTAYAALDHPMVSSAIFHPRPEMSRVPPGDNVSDHLVPVDEQVAIGARFHSGSADGPTILYFHGNGEIVADYDDLGPIYNEMNINLFAVDYRGYGCSSGSPTVSTMMADCHLIFDYVRSWLQRNRYSGPLIIMGRSLGSASALELAAAHADQVDGLIIESGFAFAAPLLRLLGVLPEAIGFTEEKGFRNKDKISRYKGPTLIIHAEFDHIIPFKDGQALYEASGAGDKRFLKIKGANHNDIMLRAMDAYMKAIRDFAEAASSKP